MSTKLARIPEGLHQAASHLASERGLSLGRALQLMTVTGGDTQPNVGDAIAPDAAQISDDRLLTATAVREGFARISNKVDALQRDQERIAATLSWVVERDCVEADLALAPRQFQADELMRATRDALEALGLKSIVNPVLSALATEARRAGQVGDSNHSEVGANHAS